MENTRKDLNIVTGSSGLIGSKLCQSLRNEKTNTNIFIDLKKDKFNDSFVLDLTDCDLIDDFIGNISIPKSITHVNIIQLAVKDNKLGEDWELFEDFSINNWRKYTSINQDSVIYITSRLLKILLPLNVKIHFIFFPSLYNFIGPTQELYSGEKLKPFEYIGSKSFTLDLMKYINCTYGYRSIRSNCLVPHLIVDHQTDVSQSLLDRSCTKETLKVVDVVKSIMFLLSSPTNLVGQCLKIDGGWLNK